MGSKFFVFCFHHVVGFQLDFVFASRSMLESYIIRCVVILSFLCYTLYGVSIL